MKEPSVLPVVTIYYLHQSPSQKNKSNKKDPENKSSKPLKKLTIFTFRTCSRLKERVNWHFLEVFLSFYPGKDIKSPPEASRKRSGYVNSHDDSDDSSDPSFPGTKRPKIITPPPAFAKKQQAESKIPTVLMCPNSWCTYFLGKFSLEMFL